MNVAFYKIYRVTKVCLLFSGSTIFFVNCSESSTAKAPSRSKRAPLNSPATNPHGEEDTSNDTVKKEHTPVEDIIFPDNAKLSLDLCDENYDKDDIPIGINNATIACHLSKGWAGLTLFKNLNNGDVPGLSYSIDFACSEFLLENGAITFESYEVKKNTWTWSKRDIPEGNSNCYLYHYRVSKQNPIYTEGDYGINLRCNNKSGFFGDTFHKPLAVKQKERFKGTYSLESEYQFSNKKCTDISLEEFR